MKFARRRECYPEQAKGKEPESLEYRMEATLVSLGIGGKGTMGWGDAQGDFLDPRTAVG
jgi:hypothetical protein